MHQRKIIHRDLKPENVLIVPEEGDASSNYPNVKITDFGFAQFYQDESELNQAIGTPLYIAPEIIKKEPYNTKVDVWSIGVIAHILLSGAVPFYGKSRIDIYRAIVHTEPTFGRFKAQMSLAAVGFTMLMLEKNPAKRPTAA